MTIDDRHCRLAGCARAVSFSDAQLEEIVAAAAELPARSGTACCARAASLPAEPDDAELRAALDRSSPASATRD